MGRRSGKAECERPPRIGDCAELSSPTNPNGASHGTAPSSAVNSASSAESVGQFRLRQVAKLMI
jgi:hypothetical protein